MCALVCTRRVCVGSVSACACVRGVARRIASLVVVRGLRAAGEVIRVSIGRLPALPRVVCGRPDDESRSPPRVFASSALVYRPAQKHVCRLRRAVRQSTHNARAYAPDINTHTYTHARALPRTYASTTATRV